MIDSIKQMCSETARIKILWLDLPQATPTLAEVLPQSTYKICSSLSHLELRITMIHGNTFDKSRALRAIFAVKDGFI